MSGAGRARLLLALLALAAAPILLAATASPRDGQVAVVGRPGSDEAAMHRLIATAGGVLVRGGGPSSVVLAASDEPGFVHRLYRVGAWLVLEPVVAGVCMPTPRGTP